MKDKTKEWRVTNGSRAFGVVGTLLLGLGVLTVSTFSSSASAMSVSEVCDQPVFKNWKAQQSDRLWAPDIETLEREKAGELFVYNCFTDNEIDRFFSTNYDRIDNSHFYPILEVDPATGEPIDGDDDC